MAGASMAVQQIFREISGGVANPAIAGATIIWQEFTLNVDNENNHSQWTYEYAISFIAGPFCGAFLAGVVHNMQNYYAEQIKNYVPKSKKGQQQDPNILNSSQLSMSQSAISHSVGGGGTPCQTSFKQGENIPTGAGGQNSSSNNIRKNMHQPQKSTTGLLMSEMARAQTHHVADTPQQMTDSMVGENNRGTGNFGGQANRSQTDIVGIRNASYDANSANPQSYQNKT